MKNVTAKDTLKLSVPERIVLVEEIWDTIVDEIDREQGLNEFEKEIVDRRIKAYQKNPDSACSWETVYSRIIAGK